jgi:hypothetical protein
MKSVSRISAKKPAGSHAAHRTTKRASSLSKIARTTKRYGKQTLRDLLLSKTFHSAFKVFFGLLVAGTAMYGAYAFIGNAVENDVVVSRSEIVARVAKHIELPEGEPEAVVRVQDAETLQTQADLYENVKEGDYILVYPSLAVVYDLRNDHIVALKSTRK